MGRTSVWAGVDVGAERKGFHLALVDDRTCISIRGGARDHLSVEDAVCLLSEWRPGVIAIDSPCEWASDSEHSRPEEKRIAREICGIRWTPHRSAGAKSTYYAWVRHGLKLYEAIREVGNSWRVVECFPTASWTRLGGKRGSKSRARWSEKVLRQSMDHLPARMNQDQRDAIGAALTARMHARGETEPFGKILVPARPYNHQPKLRERMSGRSRS